MCELQWGIRFLQQKYAYMTISLELSMVWTSGVMDHGSIMVEHLKCAYETASVGRCSGSRKHPAKACKKL